MLNEVTLFGKNVSISNTCDTSCLNHVRNVFHQFILGVRLRVRILRVDVVLVTAVLGLRVHQHQNMPCWIHDVS